MKCQPYVGRCQHRSIVLDLAVSAKKSGDAKALDMNGFAVRVRSENLKLTDRISHR